jgi:hypothetical protein
MSLSDYLLKQLQKSAENPTEHELLERIDGRQKVSLSESPDEAVRAVRSERDAR